VPDPSEWGVYESYRDHKGVIQQAPAETVARILDVMGADTARPPECGARVITQQESLQDDTAVSIELEDGTQQPVEEGRVAVLPFGYHRLLHRDGSSSRLIVSPGACSLPADLGLWGWAVQLYGARSRDSWGMGDLHDLGELGRWARSLGAGALLINPLDAVDPGLPQQASPYYPTSRCFLDPLYLRVEGVPGASGSPEVELLANRGRALNSNSFIDRDAVYLAKIDALNTLWRRSEGTRAFDDYRAERGVLLEGFATYMALVESLGSDRAVWPRGFEGPDTVAVIAWRNEHTDRVMFHQWVQWLLDEQLQEASKKIDLIGDLPVGVDPGGADAWIWRDVFASSIGVGAPPDEINSDGQSWGLAAFDPWKLRAAEYEPFIQTVRAALRHGSGLRIDHVMGLFRLFWIPDGLPPSAGTYVRYPSSELLNIVALESHRAAAYIIGEDLGTVEEEVREDMRARDMLSYQVLWFEDGRPSTYPPLSLATVTNHDLPTIAGVWSGADLEEQQRVQSSINMSDAPALRRRLKDLASVDDDATVDTVIEATYGELAEAPSMIVLATLEDALGVRARPNIPGTTTERINWSKGLPLPIEELQYAGLPDRIAHKLARRGGGRR
jgi:4-alpha-glucanotransferase